MTEPVMTTQRTWPELWSWAVAELQALVQTVCTLDADRMRQLPVHQLALGAGLVLFTLGLTYVVTQRLLGAPDPSRGKRANPGPLALDLPLVSTGMLAKAAQTKESELVHLYVTTEDGPSGPSFSPFCQKIEAFLRFTRVPYKKVYEFDFDKDPPLGKVPFIAYRGQVVPDSSLIIDYLVNEVKLATDLDKRLMDRLRSQSLAYQVLLEGEWAALLRWESWVTDRGWSKTKNIFAAVPWFLRGYVQDSVRKAVIQTCNQDGFDRLPAAIIHQRMDRVAKALATLIDRNEFAFSLDHPTTLDATLYGFLMRTLALDSCPQFTAIIRRYPNLIDYVNRLSQRYFPDYPTVARQD
ncbi:hypothetical protein H4R35_006083 [Dimargaris xerosporica]|nr:hypothetical protein H4R35_006083 [Dimargaris xerosporica]